MTENRSSKPFPPERTGPATSGTNSAPLIVLVDAENVRRSTWPNIPADELVVLCDEWAEHQGVEVEVVFEGAESADDVIARRAAELAGAEQPYWLVTSDRGLRERAGDRAAKVIGGGSFVQTLRRLRSVSDH